jgi:O-6-methylguanine DNA methyltransferase
VHLSNLEAFALRFTRADSRVDVDVYVDFLCPYCGKFFAYFGESFKRLLDANKISLTVYTLSWIDHFSNGEHYSIRSALSALKVQESNPEILWSYLTALFTRGVQPQEASRYRVEDGSNEHLASVAKSVGASTELVNEILQVDAKRELAQMLVDTSQKVRDSNLIKGTPSMNINNVHYPHYGPFEPGLLQQMFPEMSTFEADVLSVVSFIPSGEVKSYEDVSMLSGHSGSARAVGSVCRTNPIPLLIPCHRVVPKIFLTNPSPSNVGQYALGGEKVKAELLKAEGVRGL